MNLRKKMKRKDYNSRRSSQPLCWDSDCRKAKREKYIALRNFRNTNSRDDLNIYTYLEMKSIKRDKKYKIARKNRDKLIERRNNPREFWKLIKSGRSKPSLSASNEISSSEWLNHFKGLLNVDVVDGNMDNELQNIVHVTNADELNMLISDSEIVSEYK